MTGQCEPPRSTSWGSSTRAPANRPGGASFSSATPTPSTARRPRFSSTTNQRAGNIAASAGLDPVDLRKYNEYYVGVDPWARDSPHSIVTGAVLPGHGLCPGSALERSEFYADFLRPMDAFHQFCGIISIESSMASAIASLRPRRRGPFQEEELSLLRILMPHLQRALALHRRLGWLHSSAHSAMTLLTGCRTAWCCSPRTPESCLSTNTERPSSIRLTG